MPHSQKIATCCYCGTRAALTLKGVGRHELACSNCGAPLRELKMLKTAAKREPGFARRPAGRLETWDMSARKKRRKPKKRRRSMSQRFLEEFFDVAEDIFDDILD